MSSVREEALHRQQGVLTKFSELALRSENLNEILGEACRLVGEGLGVSLTKIMELQEDGRTLLVRAGVGWPPGVIGTMTIGTDNASSEDYVLRGGSPAISQDIKLEKRFAYPEFIVQAGLRSLVSVVIIGRADSKPYGILQVGSLALRDFTPSDTDFLLGYANLMAAAVSRLRVLLETRQSEQRLRVMLEGIPQLVWRAMDQGDYTWTGPQWTAHTGLSNEASCGKGWLHVVHPDDQPGALQAWREVEANGMFKLDCRFLHFESGRYVWFRNQAMPLHDEHGKIIEWIGTATDIDDQIRVREIEARNRMDLETRVAERTAELEQAATTLHREVLEHRRTEEELRQSEKLRAIGQLTGGIAHDFNNMLQSITGSLEIIRSGLQKGHTTQILSSLDRADRGAQRAAALTHRLLSFARRQTLNPKLIDLDQIARDMEEMIRRLVGPSIQTELKLFAGQGLVMCDVNQMESALLNLCINARDAMPNGGWLTVSTQDLTLGAADLSNHEGGVPGRYVSIAITDTGIGMTPDVMAHIFEPFFTTKPFGQGTGLGLSQIYGFVRQSGGIIQVETVPQIGTTIRLCLPAHEESRADRIKVPRTLGKAVLLVEDEQDIREIIAEQLRGAGYQVLEADNGGAALRLVKAGAKIDFLISDIGLPGGMNGREMADLIRHRHPGLPVILITGHDYGENSSDMQVLRKPFSLDALTTLVEAKLATVH